MPKAPASIQRAARSKKGRSRNSFYQSQQWLRMLIDSAEDYAIFAVDPQGKITTWNKGAEKLFRYNEQEIVGKDFSIIFTPEDRARGAPKQEAGRAMHEGFAPDERWHLRKDGSRLFVQGCVRPLRDSKGQVQGFLKVAHDITGQKHFQELQAQYQALFESAPGLYLVLTPKTYRIVAASDAYLHATMSEREKILGKGLFEVFPDDPANPGCTGERNLRASLERVVRERRRDVMPVQYYPIPRPADRGGGFEERWWSPVNIPVFGKNGEVAHIIHRVEDMTPFVRRMQEEGTEDGELFAADLRLQHMAEEIVLRGEEVQRANEEIGRARAELEAVFQSMQGGVIVSDSAGNLTLVNEAAARITGYPSAESLKENIGKDFELWHLDGRPVPPEDWPLRRVLRGETITDWQLRVKRRDTGQEWFFSFSGQPVRDPRGELLMAVVVMRDITRTKQMQEALRESEERFRVLADSSPTLIWVTDREGDLIFTNRTYLETFGKRFEQVVGAGWKDLVHADDLQEYTRAFLQATAERKAFRTQVRLLCADGRWHWFDSHGVPRLSSAGEFLGMAGSSADVTEIKQARDRLARLNEELEERVRERTARLTESIQQLESFSYSLSHDMRAPLRAMQSFAQILRTDFAQKLEPEALELLNRIISSAGRLDQLIQDVLALNRVSNERISPRPIDLEKLIHDVVQERATLQAPQADVEVRAPLLKVVGHEASVAQCVSNLLDNAVKFVEPGVRPRVDVWTERHNGQVRLWMADNGIGIPQEYQERIFGIFQRLHGNERYHGTGIGLAIVRKAVERMGGKVGVESQPGKGSRFWLDLPSGEHA